MPRRTRSIGSSRFPVRLAIAGVIALIAIVSYFGSSSKNPITGSTQQVAMSVPDEIALGLQAVPEMSQQFGGLEPDAQAQARVDRIGQRLLQALDRIAKGDNPYPFEFHVLADDNTINAFALPGGQVFITDALYDRLTTEGQLAGVIAHEIGHVVERHGAEHLAKAQLTQGLVGAVGAATYDPENPNSQYAAAVAAAIGQLVNLKYGRDDELECDQWGVVLLGEAGYDPRAMIEVMRVLAEAGGGGRQAEFFATHPNPENRIQRIEEAIARAYPDGIPQGATP